MIYEIGNNTGNRKILSGRYIKRRSPRLWILYGVQQGFTNPSRQVITSTQKAALVLKIFSGELLNQKSSTAKNLWKTLLWTAFLRNKCYWHLNLFLICQDLVKGSSDAVAISSFIGRGKKARHGYSLSSLSFSSGNSSTHCVDDPLY